LHWLGSGGHYHSVGDMHCVRWWLHNITNVLSFFSNGSTAPWGPRPPHFSRLHDHTRFRHTTLGRTPLDEGPALRRDLYPTTHNTHKRQTSMPYALGGIRTHNPTKRAAADPRLRPRGHWNRHKRAFKRLKMMLYSHHNMSLDSDITSVFRVANTATSWLARRNWIHASLWKFPPSVCTAEGWCVT
jgi:hypothetical protein